MPTAHKVFLMVLGNTMDCHKMFMVHLKSKVNLCEVKLADDCDFIIAFVPIVSRAGTDIQAAIEKIPKGKPVVLVVLHHTFDPHYLPPDRRQGVKRNRVFAVDCLFHEDQGLLKCRRNHDAVDAVKNHLIEEQQHEDWTDQEDENRPLVERRRRPYHEVESQELADRKCFLRKVLVVCIVACVIVSVVVGLMVGIFKDTYVGIYAGAGAGATLVTIVMIIVLVKYQQVGKKLYLSHTSH